MAVFAKAWEPVGFVQSVSAVLPGLVAQLNGSATGEEIELVKKTLESIDRQLAAGKGLMRDADVTKCEDSVGVVYQQLAAAVRAGNAHKEREKEVFLEHVTGYKLDRQLHALYNRLLGVSVLCDHVTLLQHVIREHRPRRWQMIAFCQQVNFVLATGLLCLLLHGALTGRDTHLMMSRWTDKMAALYRRMEDTSRDCAAYFKEQAQEDLERFLPLNRELPNDEKASSLLKIMQKNYDWLRWGVMVSNPPVGGAAALVSGDVIAVRGECGTQVVLSYRESPGSLDKAKINQLIGELEWKLPNPPPDVYANIEADPGYAKRYLAERMLKKLEAGLSGGVTIHTVPGKMDMAGDFPRASCLLYEYKHRMATGTVCIFG
ncbi:protein rapunzel-like [Gastrophryne carolinensis]